MIIIIYLLIPEYYLEKKDFIFNINTHWDFKDIIRDINYRHIIGTL